MFDLFSGQHILILLVVLLVVVGPRDLPRLMHMMGQWAGKARRMAEEFKRSFDDMARQEELDQLRRELDAVRQSTQAAAEETQRVAEAQLAPASAEPRAGEYRVSDTPSLHDGAVHEEAMAPSHPAPAKDPAGP
jgi:sec-independent protein translocase protein TatB